jgi:hypothetical protein
VEKPSICIGIPCFGTQESLWWAQFAQHVGELHKTVELNRILVSGTMATDHNRNLIVNEFLQTEAEWLFWIDADTIVPIGAIDRLIATGKTMVSGLYYGKNPPHPPIAYYAYNNGYRPIDKQGRWEKGEILPVDACGMGCMLTHRSVFEDIKNSHIVMQELGGGIIAVHKDDIKYTNEEPLEDGVVNGQRRKRLVEPTLENLRFPFFALEHGRTEDMWFFELAARAGHKAYLDTSVECEHLRAVPFTGSQYRDIYGH